jgi:DNA processing protein
VNEDCVHALALHRAHCFLTDKNRRVLEAAGDFQRFARILLGAKLHAHISKAKDEISRMAAGDILAFTDADYPPLLKEIGHAPFALYLRGNRSLLSGPAVSIVGTREPSDTGRQAAANLAAYYASEQQTVLSGIARGVDSIAHHSALAAGGKTIAILPNGFDHLYPLENRDLYEAAKTNINILLVSEYPPEQKPQRHHFIRRNRLIAGLSPLTVFVEGDVKSGGMITVNHALTEGRDVAALAHPSLTNNAGGEKLISEGAENLAELALGAGNRRVSA